MLLCFILFVFLYGFPFHFLCVNLLYSVLFLHAFSLSPTASLIVSRSKTAKRWKRSPWAPACIRWWSKDRPGRNRRSCRCSASRMHRCWRKRWPPCPTSRARRPPSSNTRQPATDRLVSGTGHQIRRAPPRSWVVSVCTVGKKGFRSVSYYLRSHWANLFSIIFLPPPSSPCKLVTS